VRQRSVNGPIAGLRTYIGQITPSRRAAVPDYLTGQLNGNGFARSRVDLALCVREDGTDSPAEVHVAVVPLLA
jgi:hypothetical protein